MFIRLLKLFIAGILLGLFVFWVASYGQAQHMSIQNVEWGQLVTIFIPEAPSCGEKVEVIRVLRQMILETQAMQCSVVLPRHDTKWGRVTPFVSNWF